MGFIDTRILKFAYYARTSKKFETDETLRCKLYVYDIRTKIFNKRALF